MGWTSDFLEIKETSWADAPDTRVRHVLSLTLSFILRFE